jgi:hypothetical protein
VLHRVLQEIEAAQGSISLTDLSRKLAVDPGALAGMIQYWVRKGRLKDDSQQAEILLNSCHTGACGGSCPGPQGCPFVMKLPQTYTLTPAKHD